MKSVVSVAGYLVLFTATKTKSFFIYFFFSVREMKKGVSIHLS